MARVGSRDVSAFVLVAYIASAILALPVFDAYVLDLIGVSFTLAHLVPPLAVEAIAIGWGLRRAGWRVTWSDGSRLAVGGLVFLVVLAVALFADWPTFLPSADSVDAVHHYLLIDYLYQHQRLVHDPRMVTYLGEMVGYPFAACFLVAFAAWVLSLPPLELMAPLCALLLAATAAYAYAIVTELARARRERLLAFLVAPLVLWPTAYSLGQFTRDFFLTEMLGIAAVLGLGYWLVYYLASGDRVALGPMVGLGTLLVFSYPTLMPSFALAFAVAPWLTSRRPTFRRWLADGFVVGLPILVVAILYLHDRVGLGMEIIRNNGATISPGASTVPLPFAALAVLGLAFVTSARPLRPAAVLVWAALFQTACFFGALALFDQLSPYAVKKMFFLVVPELAIVAALLLVRGLTWLGGRLARGDRAVAVAGVIALVGLGFGFSQAWVREFGAFDPRRDVRIPLTPDQVAVASWAKQHLAGVPLSYLSDDGLTAYWVHVGLLGNPRYSAYQQSGSQPPRTGADPECSRQLQGGDVFVAENLDRWTSPAVDLLFRRGETGILRPWPNARVTSFDGAQLLTGGERDAHVALGCVVVAKGPYRPGDSVLLAPVLRTTALLDLHFLVEARLRDAQGRIWSRTSVPVTPLNRSIFIASGVPVGQRILLPTPRSLPSGSYRVELVFFDDRWGTLQIAAPAGPPRGSVVAGPVTIASAQDLPAANERPRTPIGDELGGVLDLVGFDPPAASDGRLGVDLYWRAIRPVPRDYTFFAQLLDEQGKVVAQTDGYPWDGRYPTSAWEPGHLVRDHERLSLPTSLPAGHYRLIAGAYLLATMRRLPVQTSDHQAGGDFVSLTTLTLR